MRPFNIDVDYESKAFGLDYAVHLVPSDCQTDWVITVFVRFPPGHFLYRKELEALDSQDIPDDLTITFCDYGTVGRYADHSSWWIGFTFGASKFGDIVTEAENLIGQLKGCNLIIHQKSGGATVGSPAWEEV